MQTLTKNLPKCQQCPVRASALFGHLNTEMLDVVRALRTHQLVLEVGEHLYHQGDSPSKAYTVYEGWVVLYKNTHDGERQIIRFALAGEFLGYKLGNNTVYDHSAQALSDVKLCSFPISEIINEAGKHTALLLAIQSMNDTTMERCHSSITSIANKTAEQKVAYLFLTLYAREQEVRATEDNCIPFYLTQEDIGDALGLTSIHVNRVVQGLRRKGLLSCKNRCLSLHKIEELIEVAKMDRFEAQQFNLI
ncbi:MAG: Crp/Fnr family transcriptional regulator [Arenicellales bacterium]